MENRYLWLKWRMRDGNAVHLLSAGRKKRVCDAFESTINRSFDDRKWNKTSEIFIKNYILFHKLNFDYFALNPNTLWYRPIRPWWLYWIHADATELKCRLLRALAIFCTISLSSNPKCTLFRLHRQTLNSSCPAKSPGCTRIRRPCGQWTISYDSFWIDSTRRIYKFYYLNSGMPAICHSVPMWQRASSASLDRQCIWRQQECPTPRCAYFCRLMWSQSVDFRLQT